MTSDSFVLPQADRDKAHSYVSVNCVSRAEKFRECPVPVIEGPVHRIWRVAGLYACRHVSVCVRGSAEKYKSQGMLDFEVAEVPVDP